MPLLSTALLHNLPASLRVHLDDISRVSELPRLPMLDIKQVFCVAGFYNRQ